MLILRMSQKSIMKWLLEGDPAIRWQVMRDLKNAPAEVIAAERARVAVEVGRRLLALQTPEGPWEGDDRTMMTTIYALVLLKEFGVDPPTREFVPLSISCASD